MNVEKNNKEIQLGNLEIEIDSLRKKIQLNEEWLGKPRYYFK